MRFIILLYIMKTYQYNAGEIIYSVVMPIYNQEDIIVDNLKSIITNTLDNFEIILILDFCFDDTEKNVLTFFDTLQNAPEKLIDVTIFKNDKPLFETKCDNIGFKHSRGTYCLEIQADMTMTELGYNIHLTKPFKMFNNVIAVSGRCAHNLFYSGNIGKYGLDVEKCVSELNVNKNAFYVFDSCNRGPLLIDREKLKEMNYLDETNYFLENSDHDLMVRAYLEKKYFCGYVPIDWSSPIHLGSTRNNKNYNNCYEHLINKAELQRLNNETCNNSGIYKYAPLWVNREPMMFDI
jgi:glycosyltransferase involved in cell wall biosynthesis